LRKRVQELENEKPNYQNELLDLHNCITKIVKTLGAIDLEWVKLKEAVE
jgi:hypothetical protein